MMFCRWLVGGQIISFVYDFGNKNSQISGQQYQDIFCRYADIFLRFVFINLSGCLLPEPCSLFYY
jgi:hypothetical protein